MNQWKQPRIKIEEYLSKKSYTEFSIDETSSFLQKSQTTLENRGFTTITWGYNEKYNGEITLYVHGSRSATNDEQRAHEENLRDFRIASVKEQIKSLSSHLEKSKQFLNQLETNLERFKKELPERPNRCVDISNAKQGVEKKKKIVILLNQIIPKFESLLTLDDDSLVLEYEKLISTVDHQQLKKNDIRLN